MPTFSRVLITTRTRRTKTKSRRRVCESFIAYQVMEVFLACKRALRLSSSVLETSAGRGCALALLE
jgi:hypothetical protein